MPNFGYMHSGVWAHNGIDMRSFSLPNYTMVNQNRRLSTHGGLIIYIHDDFAYNELNNQLPITCTSTLFESFFIEMWRKVISIKITSLTI